MHMVAAVNATKLSEVVVNELSVVEHSRCLVGANVVLDDRHRSELLAIVEPFIRVVDTVLHP